MKVCDKCLKKQVSITLRFRTKSFELCDECAKRIVAWLEKKPIKEQLSNLWDKTKGDYGGAGI